MQRTIFSLILFHIFLAGYGQVNDKYVRLFGKVLGARDSSGAAVTILYEKLPYYDDMGIYQSNSEGAFEFYLVNNETYTFKLSGEGFIDTHTEFVINSSADGTMTYTFYIKQEEEPEVIKLEHLIFARGSERITESSFEELDQLVKYLDERPTMVIQLEGHTDFAGNAEANMALSQARVDAVKDYLVGQGVKKNRVLTKAFGGTQPLYNERTDEAKTLNRRVEVRVISK